MSAHSPTPPPLFPFPPNALMSHCGRIAADAPAPPAPPDCPPNPTSPLLLCMPALPQRWGCPTLPPQPTTPPTTPPPPRTATPSCATSSSATRTCSSAISTSQVCGAAPRCMMQPQRDMQPQCNHWHIICCARLGVCLAPYLGHRQSRIPTPAAPACWCMGAAARRGELCWGVCAYPSQGGGAWQ